MSNDQTIEHLNKALQMEMSVAHQYQLHAHVLKDWGLTKLAQQMRKEMQEELGHSNRFIERIMFLKGNPDIPLQKPPHRAKNLVDMFKADLSDRKTRSPSTRRPPTKPVISARARCSSRSSWMKKGTRRGSNSRSI
jgi:bacterioferritin